MNLLRTFAGIAMLLTCAARVHAQGSDTIEPVQGRDIRCQIKGTTPQGIQYEIGGQSQQISVADIKSVKFAGEPVDFTKARNRLTGGQFDDALTELQKVNPTSLNEFQKAEFAYLVGIAEVRKSLRDGTLPLVDAATSVNKFLETYPTSYHFFEMTEWFGSLAFHSGKFAAAEKSFQQLTTSNVAPYVLAGYLGLARTALEQSQWDNAQTQLDAIAAHEANDNQSQEIKLIAKSLSARVLAEKNQIPQAVALLEEIIKNESDERTRVFANVYNSLGFVYMRAGDAKNALLAFLHTDQLYANETELHAEALYHLSAIWAQINDADRANRSKQALSQQYRNSLWASKK